MLQRTVERYIHFKGKTPAGNRTCQMLVMPAPEDHGILFSTPRGKAHANIRNARENTYSISLMDENKRIVVRVVEHVLAALYALRIDNARIVMTEDMPPIFDDSIASVIARIKPQVKLLRKVRRSIGPTLYGENGFQYPMSTKLSRKDRLIITPSDDFFLTGIFDHPKARFAGRMTYTWDGTLKTFEKDLMEARPQVLLNRITKGPFFFGERLGLHSMNDKNSLISYGKKWENSRYEDQEAVRHFVIDRLGALALLPFLIKGHVTFDKTGHSFDIAALRALCREILRQRREIRRQIMKQRANGKPRSRR